MQPILFIFDSQLSPSLHLLVTQGLYSISCFAIVLIRTFLVSHRLVFSILCTFTSAFSTSKFTWFFLIQWYIIMLRNKHLLELTRHLIKCYRIFRDEIVTILFSISMDNHNRRKKVIRISKDKYIFMKVTHQRLTLVWWMWWEDVFMKDAPFHWVAPGLALFRFNPPTVFSTYYNQALDCTLFYSSIFLPELFISLLMTFKLLDPTVNHSSSYWSFSNFCFWSKLFSLGHLIQSKALNIICVVMSPQFIPLDCISTVFGILTSYFTFTWKFIRHHKCILLKTEFQILLFIPVLFTLFSS